MKEYLAHHEVVITAFIGFLGTITLEQIHGILGIALGFTSLGYVATKWYREILKAKKERKNEHT